MKEEALNYHAQGRAGKLGICALKPMATQEDLSLAYSPGVAEPCLAIAKNPDDSYKYTSRGHLVAVISNGTAVLGLGDIGALASKPVMEGKAVLFKKFANLDVFDLEINERDPQKLVDIITALEPTFGGINLEDIKAPECFFVEQELKKRLKIPVFHDDQHGTAVVATAGLMNALELTGKDVKKIKVVFSGAGAAGIACAHMCLKLGILKDHIFLVDRLGLVTTNRSTPEPERAFFARNDANKTLAQVLPEADVFIGVSSKDVLTPQMLLTMNKNPIVFALANPDPEISYPMAILTRRDVIMATGRSDFPNQVNNVLGFPFIFKGTLDVGATHISENMKMAAAIALAKLAKEKVPTEVLQTYKLKHLEFGRDYIIPKPLDPRVLYHVAPAVAQSACQDKIALRPLESITSYVEALKIEMQT